MWKKNVPSNVKRGMLGCLSNIWKWIIHTIRYPTERAMLYVKGMTDIYCLSGWGFAVQVNRPFCLYSFQQQETPLCKTRWAGLLIRNSLTWLSTQCKIYFLCVWNYYKCTSRLFIPPASPVQQHNHQYSHENADKNAVILSSLFLFFQPIANLLILCILWPCRGKL